MGSACSVPYIEYERSVNIENDDDGRSWGIRGIADSPDISEPPPLEFIISIFLSRNSDICTEIKSFLHSRIFLLNRNIFSKFLMIYEFIKNSFIVLFSNSKICSVIVIEGKNRFLVSDAKLLEDYNLLQTYINKIKVNAITDLIKDFFKRIDEQNDLLDEKLYQENSKASLQEYSSIFSSISNIGDTMVDILIQTYVECMNLLSLSHRILTEALSNGRHYISEPIKPMIFRELQNGRFLLLNIKDDIEEFVSILQKLSTLFEEVKNNITQTIERL